ncbi:MAG TPA: hypothetical protein VNN19_03485 [bacterium]|nr:hypothetical protein [bacterium]
MADDGRRVVFPPMGRVRVRLHGKTRRDFEALIRERGWTAEEGVKILLGYAAALARADRLSAEDRRHELGAARGELAVLRHRAFMADDAMRTLTMNVTGFEKSLEQFEKTLPRLDRQERELRARLDELVTEAARRGIAIAPEDPETSPIPHRFLDFYRRHVRE